MKDLFYRRISDSPSQKGQNTEGISPPPAGEAYAYRIWRPSEGALRPPGVGEKSFAVWWGFHRLRIFSNRDYGVFVIYQGDQLIHRSGVFPRYFRFPFMGKDDLQIGDTWTAPEHRGRGLATFALNAIMREYAKPGRAFWYLVEEDNASSIRAAEKAGMACIGEGRRVKRLGLSLLGSYVMDRPLSNTLPGKDTPC